MIDEDMAVFPGMVQTNFYPCRSGVNWQNNVVTAADRFAPSWCEMSESVCKVKERLVSDSDDLVCRSDRETSLVVLGMGRGGTAFRVSHKDLKGLNISLNRSVSCQKIWLCRNSLDGYLCGGWRPPPNPRCDQYGK